MHGLGFKKDQIASAKQRKTNVELAWPRCGHPSVMRSCAEISGGPFCRGPLMKEMPGERRRPTICIKASLGAYGRFPYPRPRDASKSIEPSCEDTSKRETTNPPRRGATIDKKKHARRHRRQHREPSERRAAIDVWGCITRYCQKHQRKKQERKAEPKKQGGE